MKILIACPTYEEKKYALNEWTEAVKNIENGNNYVDVLLVDNSKDNEYFEELKKTGFKVKKIERRENPKDNVANSRNLIRELFLEKNYDCLFSLEQDVIVEKDALLKLLSHKKDVVSGVVYNNLPYGNKLKWLPMVYVTHPYDKTGLWYAKEEELQGNQLIEVRGVSLSCVLIHRKVLEKIKFRYYPKTWDDLPFCEDTIKAGFRIYVDTSVKPKHLH
ncbi:MAG: glycosyltransferase [Candidatus Woesearchaeota archaeon]